MKINHKSVDCIGTYLQITQPNTMPMSLFYTINGGEFGFVEVDAVARHIGHNGISILQDEGVYQVVVEPICVVLKVHCVRYGAKQVHMDFVGEVRGHGQVPRLSNGRNL